MISLNKENYPLIGKGSSRRNLLVNAKLGDFRLAFLAKLNDVAASMDYYLASAVEIIIGREAFIIFCNECAVDIIHPDTNSDGSVIEFK